MQPARLAYHISTLISNQGVGKLEVRKENPYQHAHRITTKCSTIYQITVIGQNSAEQGGL